MYFMRGGAATAAGVVLLAAVTACSGAQPSVPDYTKASSTSTTSPASASTSVTTTAKPSAATPQPVPTTFAASQSTFILPATMDSPTIEMLRTYASFEDAFRHSQVTTTLDPAVRTYASGSALSMVTYTLSYLKDQGTTQQGPWRFHVIAARASKSLGVADVCVGGGFTTQQGKTLPFTGTTLARVTLERSRDRWVVSGYDKLTGTCS